MAMTTGGGGGGQIADINVTPAIDVLLVLLIIFMVITPLTPKGLEALVPQPPPPHQPETQTDRTVVVQVLQDNNGKVKLKINQEDVSQENLQQRLTDIFKTRAERVMFVKGDPDVEFQNVAQVIDTARGTNVIDRIGLITAKIEAGQ
jgi:biopolymer transport protein TolR